ncbi:hypothetical protein EYR38_007309 [Pleurotus pulmonarius]|nr:hypothetical protein EYR38_007309 [Pleurotus pulmonarius]
MSDVRDTADFINSLFRGCGLDEPDMEEVVDWISYSSGREIPSAEPSVTTPAVDEGSILSHDSDGSDDEEESASQGGYDGDHSSSDNGDDFSIFSDDGSLDTLFEEVEQEWEPAVPTWCIIA